VRKIRTRCLGALVAAPVLLLVPVSAGAVATVPSDFDGDGYADLAIGVPGEAIGSLGFAGAVDVLRGSAAGATATGNQFWSQDSSGIRGGSERGDGFGRASASGDFDGDGRADLAVGVPYESAGSVGETGAVSVIYGSRSGPAATGNQFWSQDSEGISGVGEAGDRFGSAVAAGDFDHDGYADLAIGVPTESLTGGGGAGLVNVLYGSAGGLRAPRSQAWTQSSPGVLGAAEFSDEFGSALAAGDVDGDGYADLAVGVPGENDLAGAVQVLRGSSTGLTARGNQLWSQDSPGVLDTAGPSEHFGAALAIGDVNRDGRRDLAVGVPGEVVQPCTECEVQGAVNVLLGGSSGLVPAGNAFFHVGSPGVPGDVAHPNQFGDALAAGDFDGDGAADLAVTAPGVDVGGVGQAGAVFVLTGGPGGLTGSGAPLTQNTPGVPDTAEELDGFAMDVTTARLTGGATDDLVIGYPEESIGNVDTAGAVIVVPGSASGLAPAGSSLWSQDSPGVRGTAEDSDQFGLLRGH
jgi:FG-GAP repeat protein